MRRCLHAPVAVLIAFAVLPTSAAAQQDSAGLSDATVRQLESQLAENPYYFHTMDRNEALAVLRAGFTNWPERLPWAAYATGLCIVDGERRRQLLSSEREGAYGESYACLDQFYTLAIERLSIDPRDSIGLQSVERLLPWMARAAAEMGELGRADSLARALLRDYSDSSSWNYGNVVHNGNQLLGRVALRRGQIDDAKQLLLVAGRTPGSPQLNSFGPRLFLARELLELGETAVVLEYLELIRRFWNSPYALQIIDQSIAEIRTGKMPTSMHWH